MITLSAKPVTEEIRKHLEYRAEKFHQKYTRRPRLAVVLIGNNPASVIYTKKKGEGAVSVGIEHETLNFPETATPAEVQNAVQRLNEDPTIDGILIQRPLPPGFSEDEVLYWVSPEKDVDAFHPQTVGKLVLGLPGLQPCTPAGVMELLKFYKINLAGRLACVIGRSAIVGKPMAMMLLQANATVIQCHSKTPNLRSLTSQAEILVVAAGKPTLVDSSFIREGAAVVDVGIHRTTDGKIIGDVVFNDVAKKAGALTPVPGGVGPMTISVLLTNTLYAAEHRMGDSSR
jgi:methylenetetrahydrofolate dehydrogenase (NADP+) / methenyltetrahydrofolate cyclohydrolase